MITNRLIRHFATAAATTIAATPAHAAVVDWGNANLVIPATYAGLYINVEARTTGSDEALGGWDINPYGAGSLSWYAPIGGGILHIEGQVVAEVLLEEVVDQLVLDGGLDLRSRLVDVVKRLVVRGGVL